ncbi:MAG TPA: VWA domain-containing protein [Coriobacteriia bacterium]
MCRLALVGTVVVGVASASAQSPGAAPAPEPPILEIATVARIVDVYAVVTDRQGRLVTGLDRDAFELREDGAPQRIEMFSRETDAPLSLGLLVDTSASQAALLPAERRRARAFLDGVLGPQDEAFVMRFDRDVSVVQGFTGDRELLGRALDALRVDRGTVPTGVAPRGTRLYDAIDAAAHDFMGGRRGRKVLVLLTDGQDQGSGVTRGAALDAVERAEAIVYSVVVADPAFYWARGGDFRGEETLGTLLKKTGGWLVRPEESDGLAVVAAELRAQYRLGYAPRRGYDGTYRRIDVHARDGRYSVRARRGYFASAE